MNEFELRRKLRSLPGERAPARDLWPDIAARLEPRTALATKPRARFPHLTGWAMAASLLAAALLLWPLRSADERAPVSTGPAADMAARMPASDPLRWQVDALRLEYSLAIAQLADAPMPPELRPAQRELKASEQALREALRADPGSTYLLGQLRRTYEHQLRLSQLAAVG